MTTATAVRGESGRREHQEDLVRRVGDRGERVAGEDGQGDLLRQEGLPLLAAPQLAADDQPFRDIGHLHDARA